MTSVEKQRRFDFFRRSGFVRPCAWIDCRGNEPATRRSRFHTGQRRDAMATRLDMATRRELVRELEERYRNASRGKKSTLLDELVALTGYHRKHAIRILSRHETTAPSAGPRCRSQRYGAAIKSALIVLWETSGRVCGKRLKPMIPALMQCLDGQFPLGDAERALVLAVSASTIDRLLANVHDHGSGGRSTREASLQEAAIASRPRRRYVRSKPSPRKPMIFDAVRGELELLFCTDSAASAATLLDAIRRRHPGRFERVSVRTMQRERKRWREPVMKRPKGERALAIDAVAESDDKARDATSRIR
jgi:hypothetical protein